MSMVFLVLSRRMNLYSFGSSSGLRVGSHPTKAGIRQLQSSLWMGMAFPFRVRSLLKAIRIFSLLLPTCSLNIRIPLPNTFQNPLMYLTKDILSHRRLRCPFLRIKCTVTLLLIRTPSRSCLLDLFILLSSLPPSSIIRKGKTHFRFLGLSFVTRLCHID